MSPSRWNWNVFWPVFCCVACLAYVPAYWWVWAPVVYYPLTGDITWSQLLHGDFTAISSFNAPRLEGEDVGPPMTWYGWMVSAVLIGLPVAALASLVPSARLQRVANRHAWWLVMVAVAITLVIDAKFFLI